MYISRPLINTSALVQIRNIFTYVAVLVIDYYRGRDMDSVSKIQEIPRNAQ